jgi:peptide/nickel transport system substrate-binding protein
MSEDVLYHDESDYSIEHIVAAIQAGEDDVEELGAIVEILVDGDVMTIVTDVPEPDLIAALDRVFLRKEGAEVRDDGIGTGPFAIDDYLSGEYLAVERWGAASDRDGGGNVRRITFLFIDDAATRVAALVAGEVDMILNVPDDEAGTIPDDFTVQQCFSQYVAYAEWVSNVECGEEEATDLLDPDFVASGEAEAPDYREIYVD